MELTQWIIGTNQILDQAAQNLPPEYVNQLRIFQQILMTNYLQSGFLQIGNAPQGRFDSLPQTRFDDLPKTRFDDLSFEAPIVPTSAPRKPLVGAWDRDQSIEIKPITTQPNEWAKLGR